MRTTCFLSLVCVSLLAGCKSSEHSRPPSVAPPSAPATLADFQATAAKYNAIVDLPKFETTSNDIVASVKSTIAQANAALDNIGKLTPAQATFKNTIGALDEIDWKISLTANRLEIIKQTSQGAALRDTATDQSKVLAEWAVGLDYRDDVYHTVKAFADTNPSLSGEDAKLLSETMRDYRRAGLPLPKAERDEVEDLRKKLSSMTTDFETHVTDAQQKIIFTKDDLEGVPDEFLEQKGVKTDDGHYAVMANITWHFLTIMENAKREDTRLKMQTARDNLARAENVPLLEQILVTRDNIAHKLGYNSWADYEIEVKMARTAEAAMDFEQKLKVGLQPKFDAELAEYRALKIKETGDANAEIRLWDWRYFANQLKKQKYTIDEEQLRVYFPYQRALEGMFSIYQRIFGLKFYRLDPPYKWVDDLQLYAVADSTTGEPLGLFYLDMFPRPGKYNHFAQFDIIPGKLFDNGKYQRPTVALICNFPAPAPGKPSLLDHEDVVTLFHEFGHAMHSILTRAHSARFSGTSVPRDFVEAPSQMLENWVWDKKVLDSFAADYRDPSKKIPSEILDKLKESRLATEGTFYRRQLSFGIVDLALHTQIHATNADDTVPLANKLEGDVFLPEPPDTAFVAYFGHLMGYDAGYYGYAWADAIAADMDTVFETAPDGYFDVGAGRRLRKEIYEVGDSRDIQVSIEKFLGRKQSIDPFLKKIGINGPTGGTK
jgi:thimet oligopeptidase